MALKKNKKTVYKKKASKQKNKLTAQDKKNRAIAFIIGVATLAIIAIMFFRYAAENNYQDILGEQANIERQSQ